MLSYFSKTLTMEKLYYVKHILVGTVHLEDLMVQDGERYHVHVNFIHFFKYYLCKIKGRHKNRFNQMTHPKSPY